MFQNLFFYLFYKNNWKNKNTIKQIDIIDIISKFRKKSFPQSFFFRHSNLWEKWGDFWGNFSDRRWNGIF